MPLATETGDWDKERAGKEPARKERAGKESARKERADREPADKRLPARPAPHA